MKVNKIKKKNLWFILFWKEYSVSSFFIEPHFCSPVIFLTWNCHIVLLIVYVCSHTRVPAESRREHPIALWATQCSWLELNSGPWKQQQLLSEQMSHLCSPLLHFFFLKKYCSPHTLQILEILHILFLKGENWVLPMSVARAGRGLLHWVTNLYASNLISIILFNKAKRGARGKAATKMVVKPNCKTVRQKH